MRANILLLVGAAFGILLAASGLFDAKAPFSLQHKSVARVNDVDIPLEQYQSIIKGLSDAKGRPLTDKESRFVLEEMIDEELMVQRGYELGFLELNSIIRNNMKMALMESIIAENPNSSPSDKTLKDFFEQNKGYFSSEKRLRVSHMQFSQKAKAEDALNALNSGKSFSDVKKQFANEEIIEIPDALLSIKDLRKYLGPSVSEKLFNQKTESNLILFKTNNSWHLFEIYETQENKSPEFKQVKNLVLKEYQRKKNEESISQYLTWLRKRAEIEQVSQKNLKEIINNE